MGQDPPHCGLDAPRRGAAGERVPHCGRLSGPLVFATGPIGRPARCSAPSIGAAPMVPGFRARFLRSVFVAPKGFTPPTAPDRAAAPPAVGRFPASTQSAGEPSGGIAAGGQLRDHRGIARRRSCVRTPDCFGSRRRAPPQTSPSAPAISAAMDPRAPSGPGRLIAGPSLVTENAHRITFADLPRLPKRRAPSPQAAPRGRPRRPPCSSGPEILRKRRRPPRATSAPEPPGSSRAASASVGVSGRRRSLARG